MCNPPAFMRVRTPPPLLYMDVIPLSSSSCTSSPFSTCFSSFSDLYIVHATLYIAKQHRQECWSNVHCQRRSRFSPFHFILSEPHSLVSLWVEFSLCVAGHSLSSYHKYYTLYGRASPISIFYGCLVRHRCRTSVVVSFSLWMGEEPVSAAQFLNKGLKLRLNQIKSIQRVALK